MHSTLLEVKSGVLTTFDGETVEVQGGAWLPPEAYLTTSAELEKLRRQEAERTNTLVAGLVLGAALVGVAAGFALGRRRRY